MKLLIKTVSCSLFGLGFVLTSVACGDGSSPTGTLGSGDAGDRDSESDASDVSTSAFSIDSLMDVQLTINASDWDTLRYSEPGLEYLANPDCPSGPRPDPYQWFKATATIDGVTYGEIEVRKKGLKGSMEPMKPSIKLKFRKKAEPYGMRRMTLNNAIQDPSFARECLAYFLFDKAGLAAPRCGLARVHVNGEDMSVYTHIEDIKSPMLARHWNDGSGSLYEITMADFVPDLLVMFDYKGDSPDPHVEQLEETARVLEMGDDVVLGELGKYLDIDAFITYWATEVLISHWDSYSGNQNNSYLYRDPTTGLYYFIPWGTDQSFTEPEDLFGPLLGRSGKMPWEIYAHGAIARRLFALPETRQRYESTLRSLLNEVWNENELLEKIDTVKNTVSPALSERSRQRLETASQELRLFVQGQKSRLTTELDDGLEEWNWPSNAPVCLRSDSVFSGKLQTQFGTLEKDILETGDGTATETTQSRTVDLAMIRGVIRYEPGPTDFSDVVLQFGFGPTSNGKYALIGVRMPKELFVQGKTVSLNYGEARNEVKWIALPDQTATSAGYIVNGSVTFTKIDLENTGDVDIVFNAPLYYHYLFYTE